MPSPTMRPLSVATLCLALSLVGQDPARRRSDRVDYYPLAPSR